MKIQQIRELVSDVATGVAEAVRENRTRPKEDDLYFDGLDDFVENYLAIVYPEHPDRLWCPSWWKHHDAIVVLQCLWYSFEIKRLENGTGSGVWFRDYLWPMMDRLTSPHGAFRECSSYGHVEENKRLPCDRPPAGMFVAPDTAGDAV